MDTSKKSGGFSGLSDLTSDNNQVTSSPKKSELNNTQHSAPKNNNDISQHTPNNTHQKETSSNKNTQNGGFSGLSDLNSNNHQATNSTPDDKQYLNNTKNDSNIQNDTQTNKGTSGFPIVAISFLVAIFIGIGIWHRPLNNKTIFNNTANNSDNFYEEKPSPFSNKRDVQSDTPHAYTTFNTNIRSCANTGCDSKGIIPKDSSNTTTNRTNTTLPYTTINVNIRACANGDCDSKGVIPKGSFVYPVFNNDELTVKDDWWLVDYSGYLCESKDYAPKSGCSQWQSNRSVRGWIHFSAMVIDIDLNQYSVKQLGTEFSPLITKNHVNIRKCFSSTCDSIGVIPKSSQIQPLLDNNGHLIMAKKWLAVWYSGQFCHPDSQNCANRLSARTVRGWIHMDKLTAHIDLDKYTTNSSDYLITTRHTNIRSCGATSCASLGVIPQGHYVYPLFNNDKIVGDGDWVAVEYSGGFCAEDSDDCSQHSSRRTVRGWMNVKTFQ